MSSPSKAKNTSANPSLTVWNSPAASKTSAPRRCSTRTPVSASIRRRQSLLTLACQCPRSSRCAACMGWSIASSACPPPATKRAMKSPCNRALPCSIVAVSTACTSSSRCRRSSSTSCAAATISSASISCSSWCANTPGASRSCSTAKATLRSSSGCWPRSASGTVSRMTTACGSTLSSSTTTSATTSLA
ncbi:hypothetical protein D3C76_1156070 [compost metagenome]